MLTRVATLLALLLSALTHAAGAQDPFGLRPHLAWRTLHTEHFVFHYPAEMEAWTRGVAERIEPVHEAVRALVGYAPPQRTTVVVDDPTNSANGSAYPFLGAPAMYLWPTPPEPSSAIGRNRGWGEMLAVHEFAHVAHMSRPSRNPIQRLIWRLSPVDFGPITRRAPRWLFEGYATYVEGKLTGSGRPYGTARPEVLRQWALDGRLPTYAQLNASGGYRSGTLAYLAGSAYLEWLAARGGDSSLVHLWRRMTARTDRSFEAAFAGVYGQRPATLYGRFAAELTHRAMQVEERLGADTAGRGVIVQKLTWYTGEPALSPTGDRIAVVLRSRDEPSRLVVWSADSQPESEAERRARARRLARDPEDVPAVRAFPAPLKVLATLREVGGAAHDYPRFFRDGRRLLVSRLEQRADGAFRPDLFEWNLDTRRLRRVTRGASVRYADPSPDGRTAVGVRCLAGVCDLVEVELASGHVRVLAAGSPTRAFHRPRYSPDGRRIAVGVQDAGGTWRIAMIPAEGGPARFVDPPDGVDRHSATFLPGGDSLVLVSDSGGIPNVAVLDVRTGRERALTRVAGGASAPEPSARDSTVYFLSEHSQGLDLRRIPLAFRPTAVPAFDSSLEPAVQRRRVARDSFPATPLGASRAYGLGPREHRVLVGGGVATEGQFGTVLVAGSDPVGRLGWTLQGAYGERSAWRGGALAVTLRRFRPALEADVFYAEHQPSQQDAGSYSPPELDVRYRGATVGAQLLRRFNARRHRYRAGASLGRLASGGNDELPRRLAFAEYAGSYAFYRGTRHATLDVALHGAAGRTEQSAPSAGDPGWQRSLATAAIGGGTRTYSVRGRVTYGAVSRGASPFEEFLVGGVRSPLVDPALLSQRIALPAAPVGVVGGRELYAYRVDAEVGLPLAPFYAAYTSHGGFRDPFRVVGAERVFAVPAMPFIRVPSLHAQAGAAYTFDAPFAYKTRAYVSLEYRP